MPSVIKPIEREPISSIVAARLEQLIRDGEYQGQGQLPPERVLAEQFDVSRSSIREAMRRMEAKGLVRVQHGVGVFITNADEQPTQDAVTDFILLDKASVPELLEARHFLECRTAELAARRLTDPEAQRLQSILAQMDDGKLTGDEYIHLDYALHQAIAETTKNRILIRMFSGMKGLMIEFASRIVTIPRRIAHANAGHRAIVDAIVARKPSAARRAMAAHLKTVEQDVLEYLENGAA